MSRPLSVVLISVSLSCVSVLLPLPHGQSEPDLGDGGGIFNCGDFTGNQSLVYGNHPNDISVCFI